MTIIYRSIFVISLLAPLPFLLVLSGQMYNIIKSTTSYYVYKRISCYFDCIHMREWTGSNRKCMHIHERTVPLAVLYADVRQHRQHGAEHRALEGGNSKQGGPDQGRPDEALHARIKAKRRPLP